MTSRARLPVRTLQLIDRIEKHRDREAALELASVFRPDDLTELVKFVWVYDEAPPTWLFDLLADGHDAWLGTLVAQD